MWRVAVKSLFQHKIRFAITTIAVVAGVSFVVGAFVLTDSVRHQFDSLFSEINAGVDLQVRGTEPFDTGAFGTRPPVSEDLLPIIRATPGVAFTDGSVAGSPAVPIGPDGKAVTPSAGPPLGVSWSDVPQLSTLTIKDGRPPTADDEAAFDVDLAKRGNFEIGQDVQIQTAQGPGTYHLVGTVTFGKSNALSGATLVAFTIPETQRLYNLEGKFQSISVAVTDGSNVDEVQSAIAAELPPGTEVVPNSTVVAESQQAIGNIVDIFGNVLLGFAGVTLFVAAFLISNIFTIVVGQRVRELALLRAVGASARQIGASVLGEAFVVGLLASILGLGFGILVALGLNGILTAAGFGSGGTSLVLAPRSFIVAVAVGLGVTLLSALNPAYRATTVPPVAAMREGYSLGGMSMRIRGIVGAILILIGGAGIGYAVFAKPDTMLLLTGMIGGAVFVFFGVAMVSPIVAGPIANAIGWPFAKIWKSPGLLAEENAARNPRRTASTASALMIGLALITTALVVGSSLKASFSRTIGGSISADWFVTTGSFYGFSPEVAAAIKPLPEIASATGVRQGQADIDGSTKQIQGVDYGVLDDMYRLGITSGGVDSETKGLMVQSDPAKDLGLSVGDEVTVTFPESGPVTLPVVAVYTDSSTLGNWIVDLGTFSANNSQQVDTYVAATTAQGVSQADAREALTTALEKYPDLKVQSRKEFTKTQLDQLNQLLVVINVFLLFAIVIAFLGITLTLALSVFERTRELGLLRAVGMLRPQMRRMVRIEAVIIAVFGAVLGVVVGLLFGLTATTALPSSVVNTIDVPVGTLLFLVVVAGLVGVLAAIFPAHRAARLDILEAIATE